MVAYMLISSMGVVDDDKVRRLKKRVGVEKRAVGRDANYFAKRPAQDAENGRAARRMLPL